MKNTKFENILANKLTSILYEEKDTNDSDTEDTLEDDELVGSEARGITLTAKGLHYEKDGFWYFPKFLRNADGEPKGEDGVYWYKKKRSDSEEGKMIEEYIGKSLEDLPFKIPAEFMGHIKKLEQKLREKGDKKSKPKSEDSDESEDQEN